MSAPCAQTAPPTADPAARKRPRTTKAARLRRGRPSAGSLVPAFAAVTGANDLGARSGGKDPHARAGAGLACRATGERVLVTDIASSPSPALHLDNGSRLLRARPSAHGPGPVTGVTSFADAAVAENVVSALAAATAVGPAGGRATTAGIARTRLPGHAASRTLGVQRTVTAVDLSRGGVRVPVDPAGWTYEDPLDLVLQLPGQQDVLVVGRLLRLDPASGSAVLSSAVLSLDEVTDDVAAAIDRYALNQLPSPRLPARRLARTDRLSRGGSRRGTGGRRRRPGAEGRPARARSLSGWRSACRSRCARSRRSPGRRRSPRTLR